MVIVILLQNYHNVLPYPLFMNLLVNFQLSLNSIEDSLLYLFRRSAISDHGR